MVKIKQKSQQLIVRLVVGLIMVIFLLVGLLVGLAVNLKNNSLAAQNIDKSVAITSTVASLLVFPTNTAQATTTIITPTPIPTPLPTATKEPSPTATATPIATMPTPDKRVNLPGGKVQEEWSKLNLTVIYEPNSFGAANLGEFIQNWQEAQKYVRDRLKVETIFPMTFELRTDGAPDPLGLGVRGFSDVLKDRIYQLYDGSGDKDDRKYITAHELGHLFFYNKIGWGANIMLAEGIAMYASDEFLRKSGFITVHDFATALYLQKRLTPLTSISKAPEKYFNGRLLSREYYDISGSFVSWLIETYGLEKFNKVYPTANYNQVYDKSLTYLNDEWINFLDKRSKSQSLKFDPAKYLIDLDRVTRAYQSLYDKAAANNNILEQATYQAIDTARLKLDRQLIGEAEEQLRLIEKTIARL